MRNYIKEIGKHSTVYTISNLLTKAIGVILIPIYTRFLTTSDYGIISIVIPLIQAFMIFYSFGMSSVVSRFYFDFKDRSEEQKSFFGTILLFILILGFTISIILSIWSKPLFLKIFPGIDFYPYILCVLWIAFFMLVYDLKLTIYRVRGQSISYGIFSVLKFVGVIVLTLITVIHFKMGAFGRVISEFIIVIVLFIVIGISLLKDINFRINLTYLKSALKYAIPVVPHAFSGVTLGIVAKYFLNINEGLSSAGLYNIGFLIASIMNLIIYSINLSWSPFFMKLVTEKKEGAKPIISQLTTYYCLFIFFAGLSITLFSEEIVKILTTKDYYAASTIIPILIFNYIITGLYYMVSTKIFYIKSAIKFLPIITISAAVLNIIMNYFLTPEFGISGAAWSNVISTTYIFLFAYFVSQKVYPVRYEYKRIILLSFITLLLLASYYFLKGLDIHYIFTLLIKISLLMGYLILLYILGFFRKSEIENLKDIYQKIRKKHF